MKAVVPVEQVLDDLHRLAGRRSYARPVGPQLQQAPVEHLALGHQGEHDPDQLSTFVNLAETRGEGREGPTREQCRVVEAPDLPRYLLHVRLGRTRLRAFEVGSSEEGYALGGQGHRDLFPDSVVCTA
ncbi:hypothetical protein OG948_56700 (plasmid) [Embleya sp. NBC_00888]|uniref:hypothetical protein n=1 Tax=Embleya sp. NBC_00888 TaxID=2975960 RepID=UPI00386DAB2F|nr:hypothetical protein OG948_56700 [Embleya sp. NBC_00888]